MSSDAQPDKLSMLVGEEILGTIFGEDLQGCPVTLEQIARIVQDSANQRREQDKNLIETLGQLVEAIHLLSTPPDLSKVPNPDELRSLLTERLDAIHTITTRTLKTTAMLHAQQRLREQNLGE